MHTITLGYIHTFGLNAGRETTPIATQEIQEPLSSEAQNRINSVVSHIIEATEQHPENSERALRNMLNEMVTKNLRTPENIGKIQDGLYVARDARLSQTPAGEKLTQIESFSRFMENFTQAIAQMYRDIPLSNAINSLHATLDNKTDSITQTYHRTQTQLQQEITQA